MVANKQDIIRQLRKDILQLQGFKSPSAQTIDVGLGPLAAAFPNGVFPTGAMHEFISNRPAAAAASGGFVAGLMAPLMERGGACVWISAGRKVFPPGLKAFGIEPDRVVFVDLKRDREVWWAMEEALKCEGLAAVVGETPEVSLTASRRFQLAVEQSKVTGFLLRHHPRSPQPIACVARWMITSLTSSLEGDMPGLGHPRWTVELTKVRNGQPGIWEMEWVAGRFRSIVREAQQGARERQPVAARMLTLKTG
jgi:protein ImuA